jgi:predicted tellurium resistance membrane protein TerC
MLDLLADPQAWAALLTLTVLEIVLGIDNVIFISVLVSRLDDAAADRARRIGLALALGFRIALLFALTWLMALTAPVFEAFGRGFSWRDIILALGGLFLIAKATHEIHREIEHDEPAGGSAAARATFSAVIAQVVVIDIVFSLDSIITAIGMAQDLPVMITAVILAVAVMYVASGPVSGFIARHPTTKMLALAFLVLIGVALVGDAFEAHIPRGYIYFAMAFAALVEVFNVMARRGRQRPAEVEDGRESGRARLDANADQIKGRGRESATTP